MEVTWLPFELHPETPEGSIPLTEYFRHFSPAQMEQMHAGLKARAEELGLPFNPPPILANTRKALALAEYARDQGRLEDLHLPLFQAFFVEGQNLADEAVLREAAARAGLDPDAALAAVKEGRYEQRLEE
ncbi:MAG: DsbA family oxidoreductase, partial [Bacillota bacterium]